jgi:phosphoenolpyruvate carboxylase
VPPKQKKYQIVKMLKKICDISEGSNPKNYLIGFVVSHCSGVDDIKNAHVIIKKHLKTKSVSVVPLFETKSDIENILVKFFLCK